MGGKNDDANQEAERARKDEEKRQARIRAGTARVNSIFDGGWAPVNELTPTGKAFDPTGGNYYDASGNPWTQKLSKFDNELIYGGREYHPGFGGRDGKMGLGDDLFSKRRQAYIDYATPQLEQQKGEAERELTFALDRSGLLDSSVRGEKTGDLARIYGQQKQQIADQALSYETEARNAVEGARSDLVSMLNATGDAEGVSNAALARATALSQPQAFSPLANIFADFTGALGTQAAREQAFAYGAAPKPRYSLGIYKPGAGSVETR